MNILEAYVNKDGTLDICAEVDTDSFLESRIEKNDVLDAQYEDYCKVLELDRDYHSAEQFAESLGGKGIYGDDSGPAVINTYNGECLLSDILQYVYWEDEDGEAYVLLQKHDGGDARGNYPPPEAYDIVGDDNTCLFDNARGAIYCEDCNHAWYTDNAYDWNQEEYGGENLRDYLASEDKPKYHPKPNPNQILLPIEGAMPEERKDSGIVWIDEDKHPHCPFCGGLLKVNSFPA